MELAELDVTFHYKFTPHWGGYLVLSGVNYSGGFLDSAIEGFHDVFGFDNNGRPAVQPQRREPDRGPQVGGHGLPRRADHGGMLDPTIGVRYSGIQPMKGWNIVIEAAAKVALQGQRDFLSTGKSDFGVQATLQRFGEHHAWYVSASGVYYDGSTNITPTDPQIVPTLVVGYERKLSPNDPPDPAGLHQRQHLLARGHGPARAARPEIPVERRGLPPLRAQRHLVRDHREPAELQQHAGRRLAVRLGL